MNLTFTIILAVLLDQWLGEPKKYHPLVFFGKLASNIETKFLKKSDSACKQKMSGIIALLLMIVPFTVFIYLLDQWNFLNSIFSAVILYFCIAGKSLKQHSLLVCYALKAGDLILAKKKVGMIVSRETEEMDAVDIRKATIESVLENGADAVFAPIFWFIIAGSSGVILYRLSNTLDAMWGYKNQRYFYFGWAAARFDDVLNWFPARLTALSYALLGHTKNAFDCWKNQAYLLASPNAGVVMTSGAGALRLKLGGSAWYHGMLKEKICFGTEKLPDNDDIIRANSLITKSLLFWIIVLLCLDLIGGWFA